MNFKKAIITSSKLIIAATALSHLYFYSSSRLTAKSPDFSAFSNFAANVSSLSAPAVIAHQATAENTQNINDEIIRVIEGEVKTAIKKTRYSIRISRPKIIEEKIKTLAAAPVKNISTEDLSSFEINNRELIELAALNVEPVSFEQFGSINLNLMAAADIKDEVVVAQASTEQGTVQTDEVKVIQPSTEVEKETIKDEDMVMFDYSEKNEAPPLEKSMDKKLYERPLSATVRNAIQREMGPVKKLNPMTVMNTHTQAKVETDESSRDDALANLDSDENIVYDYTEHAGKTNLESVANAFTSSGKDESVMNTQFKLKAREINLNTQRVFKAQSFEFIPDYDRAERVADVGGEINFEYSLSGDSNIETGLIAAHGMIPTRVELPLGGAQAMEVPLINEEGIQKFLEKQKINIEGNLILLAIDNSIVETEINSAFGARFFFDKNFKLKETSTGASYVMYAGVKSGNTLIRYLLSNKESAQKIVYVGEGELYFEDPDFTKSQRETYTFTTRNLLGNKKKELVIDPGLITFLNTSLTAKKKALNAYELKVPELVSGMRKYLEFKHLKDSIFVGTSSQKEIEIPGNDFIAKVMEKNDVSSLKDRCMVQINLSKDIRDFKASGKNRSGEMFVETSFLDKDGNFSRESELADKVFVVGEQEGLVGIRLEYTDGSSEYLKSFCADGSYIVEQL